VVDEQQPESTPSQTPEGASAPDHTPTRDEYETKPPRKAPLLAGVLVVIVILVLVALIFYFLNAASEGENVMRVPPNVASMVPGAWQAEDDGTELVMVFSQTNEYQLTGFRGAYETVGEWSVTEDDLVQAVVSWRDYEGIWYFEPVTATEMHLVVEDLDWDLTWRKVEE
jgi:hypothetical protein